MSITVDKTRLLELSEAVRFTGQLNSFYKGISADSRKMTPGFIFAAIDGFSDDGHRFIPNAVNKGAELILTERNPEEISVEGDVAVAQVPDIRLAIARLAFAFAGDPQHKLKVAGITGTNGKTTISTLVYQMLTKLGFRAGLLGTVEKRFGEMTSETGLTTGNPEQIALDFAEMLDAGCTHVLMEVSSHALDQRRTDAIDFDVAAFTNLSHDHLDYHETPEAYLKAKKRLFDLLKPDSIAVINADDPSSAQITADCAADIWEYGFRGDEMQILENSAKGLVLDIDGIRIESGLCGAFNAGNLAAAFLICRAFGCTAQNAATALSDAVGAGGRLERVGSGTPAVFVDYAHTPDALSNVLSSLRNMEPEKQLIAVFGCGGDRDRSKREVMGRIASEYADTVVVTSDNPRFEQPEAIIKEILTGIHQTETLVNPDRPAAITEAIAMAKDDAVVLIAGKGHETYQEVMGVRFPMDDRQIAARALELREEIATKPKEEH